MPINAHTDYLSLLFNFPKFPPMSILTLFFLALMRLAPLISFAPFLGSKLPTTVKMGLVFSFAAILLPHMMMESKAPLLFTAGFAGYAVKELLVGFILAFLVSVPFYIAQSAGSLIDFIRGASSLQVTDPFMQTQASPIGLFYNYTLIVLFYQIDGPFILFNGLIKSYEIIPPDGLINPLFFQIHLPVWQSLIGVLNTVLAVSIQLSAPSIVAVLMTEVFLGIANRLAPQVQITFLGMALKSLMGLMFLAFAWFFIVDQMGKQVLIWLQEMLHLIDTMKPFTL